MRLFPYITVGRILEELWEDAKAAGWEDDQLWYVDKKGKKQQRYPINRLTFMRLEKRLNLPVGHRTSGQLKWRVYTPEEKEEIKKRIKKEYNFGEFA